jgi:hypothetical protein
MAHSNRTNILLLLVEVVFVLLSFVMIVIGIINPLIVIGLCFTTSQLLQKHFYTSKMCYWICLNIFKPRTKYNHLLWGVFTLFFGVMTKIITTQEKNKKVLSFDFVDFTYLLSSIEFWLLMVVFVGFNVLVGIYTFKRRHKKR